ncbi:DUF5071 domain-containing protein [Hymenobacter negativus]|uniref:DUF5071 domain-containing protein n=1 Tax=Hymenobacter negativus TaxID=2795026 RepID=A0ABS3Q9L6_9BACT|nr:DUF5071 domain-containing protein [Hymenobacter negativus]
MARLTHLVPRDNGDENALRRLRHLPIDQQLPIAGALLGCMLDSNWPVYGPACDILRPLVTHRVHARRAPGCIAHGPGPNRSRRADPGAAGPDVAVRLFLARDDGALSVFPSTCLYDGPHEKDVLAASLATLGTFYGLLQVIVHYGDVAIDWVMG